MGRNCVPRAIYSLIESFWICSVNSDGLAPRRSTRARNQANGNRSNRICGAENMPCSRERDSIEDRLYVLQRAQCHTNLTDFVLRQRVIGIETDLCGQVQSDGNAARRSMVQQIVISLVRFLRGSEAGVHFDFPQMFPITTRREAAGPRRGRRADRSPCHSSNPSPPGPTVRRQA